MALTVTTSRLLCAKGEVFKLGLCSWIFGISLCTAESEDSSLLGQDTYPAQISTDNNKSWAKITTQLPASSFRVPNSQSTHFMFLQAVSCHQDLMRDSQGLMRQPRTADSLTVGREDWFYWLHLPCRLPMSHCLLYPLLVVWFLFNRRKEDDLCKAFPLVSVGISMVKKSGIGCIQMQQ